MTVEPIIVPGPEQRAADQPPIVAIGQSFSIQEWTGSGPTYLHVHHSDDEAWHVLAGSLTFTFADRDLEAIAGTTVFVPAGVAHSYTATDDARYLIILTPRLRELIDALHGAPLSDHAAMMRRYESAILA